MFFPVSNLILTFKNIELGTLINPVEPYRTPCSTDSPISCQHQRRWIWSMKSIHRIYNICHVYCLSQLNSGGGPTFLYHHRGVSWYLYMYWTSWIFIPPSKDLLVMAYLYLVSILCMWCYEVRLHFLCSLPHMWYSGLLTQKGRVLTYLTWEYIPEYPKFIWGIIMPYIVNFHLCTLKVHEICNN